MKVLLLLAIPLCLLGCKKRNDSRTRDVELGTPTDAEGKPYPTSGTTRIEPLPYNATEQAYIDGIYPDVKLFSDATLSDHARELAKEVYPIGPLRDRLQHIQKKLATQKNANVAFAYVFTPSPKNSQEVKASIQKVKAEIIRQVKQNKAHIEQKTLSGIGLYNSDFLSLVILFADDAELTAIKKLRDPAASRQDKGR